MRTVDQQDPDYFMSDCPMAAAHTINLSGKLIRRNIPCRFELPPAVRDSLADDLKSILARH